MLLDLQVGNLIEPVSGRRWNRSEVLRRADARTRHFKRAGLAAADRVFIHYGNRLEFFADLLSIWRLGACAVPVDPRLTPYEIENLARLAAPRLSLVDDTTDTSTASVMSAMGSEVIDCRSAGDGGENAMPSNPVSFDNDAIILFTSGSTGGPKGVVHTHRSLRARWNALRENLGVEAYARTLCALPTHFGHGLICNSLFPWLSGSDLFISEPFNPDLLMRFGKLVDEHKITALSSVPSFWPLVLKVTRPPKERTLRRIHCGSAPLSAATWKDIRRWSETEDVLNTYGITETGSWTAGTNIDGFVPEDGLIGKPWGATIRIVKTTDPDSAEQSEEECRAGEAGHVWIKTPALMKGYYQRDDLTRQSVRDGWLLTGDIGWRDDRGLFYLSGREHEEINKGGTKIYPADIDAVVGNFEGTRDVVTFGIDDSLYGQQVAIAVALDECSDGTVRRLYQWTKQRLAQHKIPLRWYLLDAIPRSPRGKINRNEVRDRCLKLAPLDLNKILEISEENVP